MYSDFSLHFVPFKMTRRDFFINTRYSASKSTFSYWILSIQFRQALFGVGYSVFGSVKHFLVLDTQYPAPSSTFWCWILSFWFRQADFHTFGSSDGSKKCFLVLSETPERSYLFLLQHQRLLVLGVCRVLFILPAGAFEGGVHGVHGCTPIGSRRITISNSSFTCAYRIGYTA